MKIQTLEGKVIHTKGVKRKGLKLKSPISAKLVKKYKRHLKRW